MEKKKKPKRTSQPLSKKTRRTKAKTKNLKLVASK